MRLAALLPSQSTEHLQRILRRTHTVFATSWVELSETLRNGSFEAALIDPQADGNNTEALQAIIRCCPRTRFIAYVHRTPESLHAVFRLSKQGLEDVFVHPLKERDPRFLNTIRRMEGDKLSLDVLTALEGKLQSLQPPVMAAVVDLFRRPWRYVSARDLAEEAGMSVRSLYSVLDQSEFGTPRKLIAIAKVIHGYSCLRGSSNTVCRVSTKLGYNVPDTFSRHMSEYLGIRPSSARMLMNPENALLHLIEALCKPPVLKARSDKMGAEGRRIDKGTAQDIDSPGSPTI